MLSYINFNLRQALRNSKGKSSLGLLFGFLYGIAALVMYGVGIFCLFSGFDAYGEVFTQAAILTGASGTLIGVRRFTKDKELNIEESNGDSN
jgi:hypothetical protein